MQHFREKPLIDEIFYTSIDGKTKVRKAPTAASAVRRQKNGMILLLKALYYIELELLDSQDTRPSRGRKNISAQSARNRGQRM